MRIAFTGKKNSGKTSSAKFIPRCWLYNLAEPLKGALISGLASEGLPYDTQDFYSARKSPKSRTLMQALGEYLRSKDPLVFIRAFQRELEESEFDDEYNPNQPIVIDDCRYLNEEEHLRKMGFKIVRVIRPGFKGDDHKSETEQDGIVADYQIVNDGSLDELRASVKRMLQCLQDSNSKKS